MEDKTKREELSRNADEHQIDGVWIALAATFIVLVATVSFQQFPSQITGILSLTALAFIGIVVVRNAYRAHLHGSKFLKIIQDQKYVPVAYVLVVFLDIIWLTDSYLAISNWLRTPIGIPYAAIIIVGIATVSLATGFYIRLRRKSVSKLGIFSEEAVTEFRRLNQVTIDQDRMWQDKIKEIESQNGDKISKIESERDIYRNWWLRTSQGTLRAFGLSENRVETLKNDPFMLSEYSLRVINYWKQNAVRKVVYYDTNYLSSFVMNPEKAPDFFADRGFAVKDAGELRKWMREAIDNDYADKCIAVFLQDVVPDTVAKEQDTSCTLRQFLEKGGRVTWRGDIPCYYLGRADKVRARWTEKGAWEILGVSYENFRISDPQAPNGRLWDNAFPVTITNAGRDIGIAETKSPIRPVPRQDVTTVYSEIERQIAFDPLYLAQRSDLDGHFVCCWKKNFNSTHPHSGFMQYYLGQWDCASEQDLENFLKFSLSGWPLSSSSTRYLLML